MFGLPKRYGRYVCVVVGIGEGLAECKCVQVQGCLEKVKVGQLGSGRLQGFPRGAAAADDEGWPQTADCRLCGVPTTDSRCTMAETTVQVLT